MKRMALVTSMIALALAGCVDKLPASTDFTHFELEVDPDLVLPGTASFQTTYYRAGIELESAFQLADESRIHVTARGLLPLEFATYDVWMAEGEGDYFYAGTLEPEGDTWSVEASYSPPRYPGWGVIALTERGSAESRWPVFLSDWGSTRVTNEDVAFEPARLMSDPSVVLWRHRDFDGRMLGKWVIDAFQVRGLGQGFCDSEFECGVDFPWMSYCAWLVEEPASPRLLGCWTYAFYQLLHLDETVVECTPDSARLVVAVQDADDVQPVAPSPLRLIDTPACPQFEPWTGL